MAAHEPLHTSLAGKLLKIVSDIDDTLMCSGGHWPAGCDRRYPRKCIYPGVLAFFKELDTRQALRVQVGHRLWNGIR